MGTAQTVSQTLSSPDRPCRTKVPGKPYYGDISNWTWQFRILKQAMCTDSHAVVPQIAPPTTGGSSTEQTPAATSDAEATSTSTDQVAEAAPDPAPGIAGPAGETPAGDALEAGGTDDEGEFTPSVFDEGSIGDDRTDTTSLNSMGDLFPSAEIQGIDLSPIQPAWVPQNVKFIVDDAEDTWLNGSDFDFVHLRNMVPVLKSPVNLLRNAYEHMRPGAWVELQDVDGQVHCDDGTMPSDWPLVRFTNHLVEAFAKFGTNSHAAVFGRQYLEEAGFVNIQHNTVKLPYGTWPKDKTKRLIGMYYRTACEEFFPAVGAIHFEMLGWSKVEREVLFAQCRNAMRDPNVHAYGMMHFWSGQKPV
ncbi:putative methyltransferase domain-containing protein [Colletotrichum sublineola]|uniref:Putative methyltransferase domain-containing protein n=1 Tax=Colletotrichum sublineola TaxID=1173701 RepID=A0A066XM12_COLSU|nr:putative methyltransferase domain-containing protein [Colletotrichum sublineola]